MLFLSTPTTWRTCRCDGRSYVSVATETSEPGSRNFLSGDEKNIRDHINFANHPYSQQHAFLEQNDSFHYLSVAASTYEQLTQSAISTISNS